MSETDKIRSALADGAAVGRKTKRAAVAIAAGAGERRAFVCARLDELRPTVTTNLAAAIEYQRLIEERGQIDIVLGQSRKSS